MIFFILFGKIINFSFNNLSFMLNLGMKSNILIVGLIDEFNKNIAYEISNRLGVYFWDIKELIEYEIADRENMIDICGVEYLEKFQSQTKFLLNGMLIIFLMILA